MFREVISVPLQKVPPTEKTRPEFETQVGKPFSISDMIWVKRFFVEIS